MIELIVFVIFGFRACISSSFYMNILPVGVVVAEDDEEVESSVCEVLSGGQW